MTFCTGGGPRFSGSNPESTGLPAAVGRLDTADRRWVVQTATLSYTDWSGHDGSESQSYQGFYVCLPPAVPRAACRRTNGTNLRHLIVLRNRVQLASSFRYFGWQAFTGSGRSLVTVIGDWQLAIDN
jgi:hypothetical protein